MYVRNEKYSLSILLFQGFHIHTNPVEETSPNCTAAGAHFNPYSTLINTSVKDKINVSFFLQTLFMVHVQPISRFDMLVTLEI